MTRKLIGALRHLEPSVRNAAIESLFGTEVEPPNDAPKKDSKSRTDNLQILYPVFPSIALLLKASIAELDDGTKSRIFTKLRKLIRGRSYIVMVPANLAYTVRLLAYDSSEEADEILSSIYNESNSMAVRRDVILAMARKDADYWISDRRKHFASLSEWEKRAILISSFILEDEGKHWRRSVKPILTPLQALAVKWAGDKKRAIGNWEIPV